MDARIEDAMQRIPTSCSQHSKSELAGALKRILRDKPEHTAGRINEPKVVKGLKNKGITFMQSDKSKRLIAMENQQYEKLVQAQTDEFVQQKFPQPTSVSAKFNSKLGKVARKYPHLQLAKYNSSDPVPSKLRVLPKDHKGGELKGRPIVAAVDAPATRLSAYLANVLFSMIKENVPAHLTSTADFIDAIKNIHLDNEMCFVSLDVVNLYGSLPVHDHTFPGVLSIVTTFFEDHKAGSPLNSLEANDFRELLSLCLTTDTIQADRKTYKQKSGLQMGNSVSGPCAIIFMNFIESQIISSVPEIFLWKRYIDDCFIVYRNLSGEQLLEKCNDVHPDILFTIEQPVNNKLPFLDLTVERQGGKFSFSLFSKTCHSGNVIHWSSCHPRSTLFNILKNEIRRAIRNSSGSSERALSMQTISERFAANGYPRQVIKNAIKSVIAKEAPRREETKKVFLTLPFQSEKQTQAVRRALRRTGLNTHLTISFKSYTLSSMLKPSTTNCVYENCAYCNVSADGNQCLTKFCIYFIECSKCGASYIGETKRTMRSRLREHVTANTSLVFRHLSTQHRMTPDLTAISWKVLHRGLLNTNLRRCLEAKEIKSRQPNINVQNSF
jgi:hypothetical protein